MIFCDDLILAGEGTPFEGICRSLKAILKYDTLLLDMMIEEEAA